VESVDRAWVLDGPDHPLARLTADEIRTARQTSGIVSWCRTARWTPHPLQITAGPSRLQMAAAGQGVLI
jgi:hypothetical protein